MEKNTFSWPGYPWEPIPRPPADPKACRVLNLWVGAIRGSPDMRESALEVCMASPHQLWTWAILPTPQGQLHKLLPLLLPPAPPASANLPFWREMGAGAVRPLPLSTRLHATALPSTGMGAFASRKYRQDCDRPTPQKVCQSFLRNTPGC